MEITAYPITFPYGATSAPYSAAHPHKGNDYSLNYEDVIVAGTKLGVSGETGMATGPHTHVQAGRDEWAQVDIDPLQYTGQPGTVEKTGTASEWGNYVCIRVGDVNVFYCHLSQITVSVGDKIGEEMAEQIDKDTSRILISSLLGYTGVAGRPNALDGSNLGDSLIGRELTSDLIKQLFAGETARLWRDSDKQGSITWINSQLASSSTAAAKTLQQIKDVLGVR